MLQLHFSPTGGGCGPRRGQLAHKPKQLPTVAERKVAEAAFLNVLPAGPEGEEGKKE